MADPALARLGVEYLDLYTSTEPFTATLWGIPGHDDRVPDPSPAAEAVKRSRLRAIRERVLAIDADALDDGDRTTWSILEEVTTREIKAIDLRFGDLAVSPFFVGPQAQVLMVVPKARIDGDGAAGDYLVRLRGLPAFFDAYVQRFRTAVADGLVPTARSAVDSIAQIDRYLGLPAEADVLRLPLLRAADPAVIAAADVILDEQVKPALARFRDHLRDDVVPHGRDDQHPGLCFLTDRDDRYAAALRAHTTTDRTPREIHDLGLEIVASLVAEYRDVGGRLLGTTDLAEIFRRLREDPALRYDDPQEAVTAAQAAVDRAATRAGGWFGRLPSKPCVVRAIPPVEARGMTVAYYQPAGDAGEHGTYWINTTEPVLTRYESEAVAFHEALPGHHLQLALQSELALPDFRRLAVNVTAYSEGWALYAERLADEMSLYSGDLARIGMLATDSLRACRLVVDTGIHALGWSRQRAIDHMLGHTALSEEFVVREVDRYVVLPGQACGYMIGRLEILRLREQARAALRDRFDVRAFHDVVLSQGCVPLSTLDGMVTRWIDAGGIAASG